MIGINLWFIPQISEHCPVITPDFRNSIDIMLIRPGIASNLDLVDVIENEWITSVLEIKNEIGILLGSTNGFDVFRHRMIVEFDMNLLNDEFLICGYS